MSVLCQCVLTCEDWEFQYPNMAISSSDADPKPATEEDYRVHVFWHEGMLKHDTGRGVFDTGMDPGFLDVLENHPENPDRVKNIVSILKRGPISPLVSWHQGRPALISELLSFHTQGYYLFCSLRSCFTKLGHV